ncbi:hypothetical protein GIB67_040811, partial [Kingdonia uniflora]
FAARLSQQEADNIARKIGVVSVFVDPIYKLHTTRSWDFLQYQTDVVIDSNLSSNSDPLSHGTDTVIGIIDTGIWPESESFKDKEIGPIPSRWKGVCMEGHDFSATTCNRFHFSSLYVYFILDMKLIDIPRIIRLFILTESRCGRKLIGARYYNSSVSSKATIKIHEQSPRDTLGHGTHTASTAAGNSIAGASYYGLATGTAKGGSPGSRIAIYKVCTSDGCRGSAILAAFDDAIADGVEILSLSLGASAFMKPDFSSDPVAIGSFHAVDKGITVVCSAGNDGPTSGTVVNAAPWILTVAATTIDRDLESDVVLGGNKVVKVMFSISSHHIWKGSEPTQNPNIYVLFVLQGEAINFSNLQKSPIYPLIYAESAKKSSSSKDDSRNCNPSSMDGAKIKGKIVLCEHSDDSYSKTEKMKEVKKLGGIGLVLIDELEKAIAFPFGDFPMTVISSKEGAEILSYINSTRKPVATILPTVSVTEYKPAPTVAYFSSRGPSLQTRNLLKPDIAAPGVNILAAWTGANSTSETPPTGQKPSQFNLLSGTSMSCPHVSGIAAFIKSNNPNWTPAAIKSAIMTTATEANNEKTPLTTDAGLMATPYDYGAGEINPTGTLQPGLIYEINTNEYLQFLCNYGYKLSTIKLISNTSTEFDCPKESNTDLISELNYPSIAISKFDGKNIKNITRTVTNVGADDETIYTASVKSLKELEVKVVPQTLQFTKRNKKLSYQVIFSSSSAIAGDLFGSITWSNGMYKVKSPFVVTSEGK